MSGKQSFWQRMGMHEWFLKKDTVDKTEAQGLTPNAVYGYIIDKFNESIAQLSFANRLVFYHEYIIGFSPDDYKKYMNEGKGIFMHLVDESVRRFYEILKEHKAQNKRVVPSSSKWVFRFVSHPNYAAGDISFIGRLLPGLTQQTENLRITFIPRQTGIAETSDVNPDILKGFTNYGDGYFEVPFTEELVYAGNDQGYSSSKLIARFEAIVPEKEYAGKKIEYLMHDTEVTVSGKEEPKLRNDIFRIPTDWVNAPHLKIRYQKPEDKLYVASFGEKTVLNEKVLEASTEAVPKWTELPMNSKLVLNGIIGVNVFKS